MVAVGEIRARSVLNKSKIFDFCLNPYTGCGIGCVYCYARLFMRRYSGHREAWGDFVDVKVNAPQVLRKQLVRAKPGTVWISSVCDPYQPLEAKYGITRECLKELEERQIPVNIQTKSALVLRDLDLLSRFENIEVGMTITTDDKDTAKLFEPGASPLRERLQALETLHVAGIRTFAFVGPLIPGNPEKLIEMLEGKADRVLIDRMNYVNTIRGFYRRHGLESAASDEFFDHYKQRFIRELERRDMTYEVFF